MRSDCDNNKSSVDKCHGRNRGGLTRKSRKKRRKRSKKRRKLRRSSKWRNSLNFTADDSSSNI